MGIYVAYLATLPTLPVGRIGKFGKQGHCPDDISEIRSASDFFVVKFIRRATVSTQLGLHRWQTVIC
jgi:hypothetical protein